MTPVRDGGSRRRYSHGANRPPFFSAMRTYCAGNLYTGFIWAMLLLAAGRARYQFPISSNGCLGFIVYQLVRVKAAHANIVLPRF